MQQFQQLMHWRRRHRCMWMLCFDCPCMGQRIHGLLHTQWFAVYESCTYLHFDVPDIAWLVWPDLEGIEAQFWAEHLKKSTYQCCAMVSCTVLYSWRLFLSFLFGHHAVQLHIVESLQSDWRPWCFGQDPVPHWLTVRVKLAFCIVCIALRYALHPQSLLVHWWNFDTSAGVPGWHNPHASCRQSINREWIMFHAYNNQLHGHIAN